MLKNSWLWVLPLLSMSICLCPGAMAGEVVGDVALSIHGPIVSPEPGSSSEGGIIDDTASKSRAPRVQESRLSQLAHRRPLIINESGASYSASAAGSLFSVPAELNNGTQSKSVLMDSATLVPVSQAALPANQPPNQTPNGGHPASVAAGEVPVERGSAAALTPRDAVLADPDARAVAAQLPSGSASSPSSPQSDTGPKRRGYPAPLDPVFCLTEYPGSAGTLPIGVPDTDPEFPLEKQIYKLFPALKKQRIKIYGWANPGGCYSSSRNSNTPISYPVVPNRIELDQGIFRVERVPDSVQTEHCDWGFRSSMLYGIDYRFTTAQGWYPATKQLFQHNYEYGFDPVELYGMFYVPKVAQGLMFKFGRYISPPDIEAQLAPDNFLWTHSQMFTVDCYTQTGCLASIKLNDNFMVQAGVNAGDDIAPWDKAAIPTGQFFVRWVSKNNNDSIYGGMDSINNGRYRGTRAVISQQQMIQALNTRISQSASPLTNFDGSIFQYNNLKPPAHDNLQQFNLTWSHRFNKKGTIVTFSEVYFLYQLNALTGGSVNNGPPHNYAGLTGPGTYIHGIAPALGTVNYTAFKITDKDYICLRPVDFLLDYKGQRTGFPTALTSWTAGWCHRFSDLLLIRPEIRYDRALNYHDGTIVKPYDNGTRRFQFTFGLDCIARF